MADQNYNIEKYDFDSFGKEHLPFTMIPNQVIQKMPAKNMKAGFLWVFLQSLSPNWNINKSHIVKHFEISESTYERWMSWLNSVGLIEYRQERKPNGSFGKFKLIVLNGAKFNPLSNSCRTAKIDGVDVNRSAILPVNGETVATANDGHKNTTEIKKQQKEIEMDKKACASASDNEKKEKEPKSDWDNHIGLYEMDNSQSVDHNLQTDSKCLATKDLNEIMNRINPDDYPWFKVFYDTHPRQSSEQVTLSQWVHDGCESIGEHIVDDLRERIKRDKDFREGNPLATLNYIRQKKWNTKIFEGKKTKRTAEENLRSTDWANPSKRLTDY